MRNPPDAPDTPDVSDDASRYHTAWTQLAGGPACRFRMYSLAVEPEVAVVIEMRLLEAEV